MAKSDADSNREFVEAEARMADRLRATPHAVAAFYDRRIGRIVVRLSTGLELAFPPHLAQGLGGARPADLADIEVSPTGLGLHFPRLDADLYVPGLMEGVFGSRSWSGGPARHPESAVPTSPPRDRKPKSPVRRAS